MNDEPKKPGMTIIPPMTDKQILDGIERVLKKTDLVEISYDECGSGMGFNFGANAVGWPWCSSDTLRDALKQLIEHHADDTVGPVLRCPVCGSSTFIDSHTPASDHPECSTDRHQCNKCDWHSDE